MYTTILLNFISRYHFIVYQDLNILIKFVMMVKDKEYEKEGL